VTFLEKARYVFSKLCLGLAAATYKPAEDLSSTAPFDSYIAAAKALPREARVLEVGTKRSRTDIATHAHYAFVNVPRENYVMADVGNGIDVDVVANLHELPADWSAQFDAFVASAVFEHLERPWIAAKEVARVLKPGGFCYVATHQTFPLHGYPSDFFRFSKEALCLIFEDAGLQIVEVAYQHRSQIVLPPVVLHGYRHKSWNNDNPSYVLICLLAVKPSSGR
jgi:SAM-dependent methyltransferase